MINLQNIQIKDNPFPYLIIPNALDNIFAFKCQQEILNIPDEQWDRYQNPFENKWTLRDKFNMSENLTSLFTYLNSHNFIAKLSDIFNYNLEADTTRNWWGIHKYDDGDFLDIHVDAGLHPTNKKKKQLTLGIYLSKDWKLDNKGHLELWSGENSANNNAKISKCIVKILPEFNKLVIFDCNDYSWHGNPEPVICKNNEKRIFITVSYLSNNFQDKNKRVKAFFVKRPDEPNNPSKDKLRLLRADPIKYKEVYKSS